MNWRWNEVTSAVFRRLGVYIPDTVTRKGREFALELLNYQKAWHLLR